MYPPLHDVTSVRYRQTTAKWAVLWHLEHSFPLAGHVSSCLYIRLHLKHGILVTRIFQNLVFLSFDVFHPNAGFLTGPQLEI